MTPRILFVHNYAASFVQTDLALLRERYIVREWYQRTRWVNIPALARAVATNDVVFGWFTSWHTLFPMWFARAFKRPGVLVVGGYDTANMPEIGYGSMRGGVRRWVARTTMHNASSMIAFSDFSRREAVTNGGLLERRVTTIYPGLVDCQAGPAVKGDLVLTVGNVERPNLKRKGLEAFVRSAALLPNLSFFLIGEWRDDSIDYLRSICPENVRFTGRLSENELRDYFGRTRVYVQASLHEGFGLSVAEAMLAGCTPVVTRAGALPEVVGDAGIYVDSAEPACIAKGIREALSADADLGKRARERVAREFPLSRRREGIYKVIDRLVAEDGRVPLR